MKDGRVLAKREVDFLPEPSTPGFVTITTSLPVKELPGRPPGLMVGYVHVPCPQCGHTLFTEKAAMETQIEAGIRWCGVLCETCGESYTIEMANDPEEGP